MNKTVVLDWDTVSTGDIAQEEIYAPGEMTFYGLTKAEETAGRIGDSEIVLCNKVLITEEIMKACPNIKYIGLFATGFNNIDILLNDASVFRPDFENSYDVVIADVPCSGLGSIGKKPDIKYNMTPEKQEELVRLQRSILENSVRYIREKGYLYNTS